MRNTIVVFSLMSALLVTAPVSGEEVAREQVLRQAEHLVKHVGNPVLDIGVAGQWDDKGCGCFSVTDIKGRLHLYYMGAGTNNSWRIGLATSGNGIRWQRSKSNPVLPQGPAGSWDSNSVSMPYVLNDLQRLGQRRRIRTGDVY